MSWQDMGVESFEYGDMGAASRKQAEKPTRWVSEAGKQAETPEPETK